VISYPDVVTAGCALPGAGVVVVRVTEPVLRSEHQSMCDLQIRGLRRLSASRPSSGQWRASTNAYSSGMSGMRRKGGRRSSDALVSGR
jgi:hypothetical protein